MRYNQVEGSQGPLQKPFLGFTNGFLFMTMLEPKIEIRDKRKGNWVWTEKNVLFSPYVSASDYKVYAGLASYAGNDDQNAWPSLKTLADKLNIGRTTVFRSLLQLVNIGVIIKEQRPGTSNIYTLVDVELIQPPPKKKEKSEHHRLIGFFHDMTLKTRGFKPKFAMKDVVALKRILNTEVLSEAEIEKIIVYFLASPNFKKFTPSLAVIFSAGILNGLLNTLKNDNSFTKNVTEYAQVYLQKKEEPKGMATLADQIEKLKQKLSIRV